MKSLPKDNGLNRNEIWFSLGVALLIVFRPVVVFAQDVDVEAVQKITRVIRWSGVFTSVFVIAGTWFGLRLIRGFSERLSDQFPARRMFFQKFATIVQFATYFVVSVLVIMLSVRLDKTVLALIGGTVAVSVGFALRDVIAAFVAGIIIMFDRPFQVGDRVSFGGEYGDIIAIGLRSVRMQTLDDNIVTIPNNKFITDVTSCGNYGELDMQVVMDFYVGLDQNIDRARSVVTEAALTSRYIHLPKPVVVLVNQLLEDNYMAVRLRLKAYVLDTRYEKAFETDVNLRVMKAFDVRGIQPPAILHRTVGSAESTAS